MLDIKFVRENPEAVKENIKKKYQDEKLPLVDEVIELDARLRAAITEGERPARVPQRPQQADRRADGARRKRTPPSWPRPRAVKAQVKAQADRLAELEAMEGELEGKVHAIMLRIPQMIDPSVPLGPDDSCNVRPSASASR